MNTPLKIVLLIAALTCQPAFSDDIAHTVDTFREVQGMEPFFKQAAGYAVFPLIGKGGIGVGGAFGKGKVFRAGTEIGKADMVQVSFGFQFGGQAYSQMVFFKDQRALDEFVSGNFEFGVEASAVALTASATAQAGTKGASSSAGLEQHSNESAGSWYKGMAVFTIAKGGLMYEASIGGQKFSFKPTP